MPKYQVWYERVTHWLHEVEAESPEEAKLLFEQNMGTCVDEQETYNRSDVEESGA